MASEYGWSIEYILEQPYPKIKHLQNAIKLRQYVGKIQQFSIYNMSQGASSQQVTEFFNKLQPKLPKVKDEFGKSSSDAPIANVAMPAMNLDDM